MLKSFPESAKTSFSGSVLLIMSVTWANLFHMWPKTKLNYGSAICQCIYYTRDFFKIYIPCHILIIGMKIEGKVERWKDEEYLFSSDSMRKGDGFSLSDGFPLKP